MKHISTDRALSGPTESKGTLGALIRWCFVVLSASVFSGCGERWRPAEVEGPWSMVLCGDQVPQAVSFLGPHSRRKSVQIWLDTQGIEISHHASSRAEWMENAMLWQQNVVWERLEQLVTSANLFTSLSLPGPSLKWASTSHAALPGPLCIPQEIMEKVLQELSRALHELRVIAERMRASMVEAVISATLITMTAF